MDLKKLRFWDKKTKSDDELNKEMQKNLENLQKLSDVLHELKRKRDAGEISQEEHRRLVSVATGIKRSRK